MHVMHLKLSSDILMLNFSILTIGNLVCAPYFLMTKIEVQKFQNKEDEKLSSSGIS
jgi:hypothetical protein